MYSHFNIQFRVLASNFYFPRGLPPLPPRFDDAPRPPREELPPNDPVKEFNLLYVTMK